MTMKPIQPAPDASPCDSCGSPLDGDYCTNENCCHFDWPQVVTRDDIKVFSDEEIEVQYRVLVRADSSVHHAVRLTPAEADARRAAARKALDDKLLG